MVVYRAFASLSIILALHKGGWTKMRGGNIVAVLVGSVMALVGAIGVFTALATPPSGNPEANFTFAGVLFAAGTIVAPGDSDEGTALLPLPGAAFFDANTSGFYEFGEPVYVDDLIV
ncbi:MAG: hypothetical protein NZV61_06730, partial [Candidatus Bipolaricaulota bacterium]|nr:hypothetical protein [Candidatus Bipolaricaulota bacterium]